MVHDRRSCEINLKGAPFGAVMKTKTTVKFYDGTWAIYRDLFSDGKELYFYYEGAEYRHKPEDYTSLFNSVVSKDEESKQIRIVDWHRSGE